MAIYHLHVRNISRAEGRSVVAAAAYRAGETLWNEAEERDSAFGGRRDVLHAEIRLPEHAPAWMKDRARLWNSVEAVEKRRDARLAKEIEFALPRELPRGQWLALARGMADAYTRQGFVVDLAIHDDGTARNPHVHLLLSTRRLTVLGFGGKMREADAPAFISEARARWAKIANLALGGAGLAGIEARSHAERGIPEVPGQHRGAEREARRSRRRAMDDDRIADARAELRAGALAEYYPRLSARPDWPPRDRTLPRGLTAEEANEFWRYWQDHDAIEDGQEVRPPDERFAVPDPDGNPISPVEQDRAERAMLAEMDSVPAPHDVDRQGGDWWTEPVREGPEAGAEEREWWDRR
jgi:hypothetical protein